MDDDLENFIAVMNNFHEGLIIVNSAQDVVMYANKKAVDI